MILERDVLVGLHTCFGRVFDEDARVLRGFVHLEVVGGHFVRWFFTLNYVSVIIAHRRKG
jgi:hypothetical protein